MISDFERIYDNVILGDGPISRSFVFHLNKSSIQDILVIDAGERLNELRKNISVESNFSYDTPFRATSFHVGKDSHVWYGGCQGWPSYDTLNKNVDSLPISMDDNCFIKNSSELLKDLGIFNFNSLTSKLNFSLQKKYKLTKTTNNLEYIYCKILKDPYLRKIAKTNSKNIKNTFISKIIITKIIPKKEYVELVGVDQLGKKVKFRGKRIHLALGTIENTRLILNSKKELNLLNNNYLGKFLSDHLSISVGEIGSKDITRVIRDFSRTSTLDGSLLWPRMSIDTVAKNGKNLRSFVHGSHFAFNDSMPIFYKFLRKIKKENFFFNKKKTGSFQLNFFFEKLNDFENSIELVSNTDYAIAPIKIKFNIDPSERDSQLEIVRHYFKSLKEIYSLTQNINDFLSKFEVTRESDLRSSVHPSGTYRMSMNSELGVVNTKSELWNDSRIRVLGAGVLPRASSTHPTLTSMVLARIDM
jgi:hypothetical protein